MIRVNKTVCDALNYLSFRNAIRTWCDHKLNKMLLGVIIACFASKNLINHSLIRGVSSCYLATVYLQIFIWVTCLTYVIHFYEDASEK